MGTNLPKNPGDALEWILNRADRWQEYAAELGLSEQAASQMLALAETARAARLNAQRQRSIARGATETWNRAIGEAIVSTVKATAQTTEQTSGTPAAGRVYALAWLSPPSPRRREGPRPGTPTRLEVELLGSGALGLSFQCTHPPGARGVVYEVYRQDAPERPFEFLATTGVKRFVDRTIPPGTARVDYQIIATRGRGGRQPGRSGGVPGALSRGSGGRGVGGFEGGVSRCRGGRGCSCCAFQRARALGLCCWV